MSQISLRHIVEVTDNEQDQTLPVQGLDAPDNALWI